MQQYVSIRLRTHIESFYKVFVTDERKKITFTRVMEALLHSCTNFLYCLDCFFILFTARCTSMQATYLPVTFLAKSTSFPCHACSTGRARLQFARTWLSFKKRCFSLVIEKDVFYLNELKSSRPCCDIS